MKYIGRNKFGKAGFGEFVPQMISRHLLGAKDTAENKDSCPPGADISVREAETSGGGREQESMKKGKARDGDWGNAIHGYCSTGR